MRRALRPATIKQVAAFIRPKFKVEQVAEWLWKANPHKRARWKAQPDAAELTRALGKMDLQVSFVPDHRARAAARRASRILFEMAGLLDDPAIPPQVRGDIGFQLLGALVQLIAADTYDAQAGWGEHGPRTYAALGRLPGVLRRIAVGLDSTLAPEPDEPWLDRLPDNLRPTTEAAERNSQGTPIPNRKRRTYADELGWIYRGLILALQEQTGEKPGISPDGPDARFVQCVLNHVRLPWHYSVWRREIAREREIARARMGSAEAADELC